MEANKYIPGDAESFVAKKNVEVAENNVDEQNEQPITTEQKQALDFLNMLVGRVISATDARDIIGVFAGVKSVAFVNESSFAKEPKLTEVNEATPRPNGRSFK